MPVCPSARLLVVRWDSWGRAGISSTTKLTTYVCLLVCLSASLSVQLDALVSVCLSAYLLAIRWDSRERVYTNLLLHQLRTSVLCKLNKQIYLHKCKQHAPTYPPTHAPRQAPRYPHIFSNPNAIILNHTLGFQVRRAVRHGKMSTQSAQNAHKMGTKRAHYRQTKGTIWAHCGHNIGTK
jgi:hypothetical protein